MPRSPKDNQEIRDTRREEILDAATQVFAEKGFARTKISEIAAAAGVSHGLLYHYFANKAGVFGAMVDAMIDRIDAEFDVPGDTAFEQIVQSIDRRRELVESGLPEANRLVVQAMMQGSVPEDIKARVCEHIESVFRRSCERIRQAQLDGDIDPSVPADELASALVMLLRGMSMRAPKSPVASLPMPSTETILRLLRPTRLDPAAS